LLNFQKCHIVQKHASFVNVDLFLLQIDPYPGEAPVSEKKMEKYSRGAKTDVVSIIGNCHICQIYTGVEAKEKDNSDKSYIIVHCVLIFKKQLQFCVIQH
jgi:hypothetical protein